MINIFLVDSTLAAGRRAVKRRFTLVVMTITVNLQIRRRRIVMLLTVTARTTIMVVKEIMLI